MAAGNTAGRFGWNWQTVSAMLVVVLGGSLLFAFLADADEVVEVYLEPAGTLGPDPFYDGNGIQLIVSTRTYGSEISLIVGDTPGLYGGTGDERCDAEALADFLLDDEEKGRAWARVQGIEFDEIDEYLAGLTPAVLMTDTWVTNHGYRDGRATPRQSILQAGTAVLVDDQGVPRARCACGNPLLEGKIPGNLDNVEIVNPQDAWDGFDLNRVIGIFAADVMAFLSMADLKERFPEAEFLGRPVGTKGPQDRPVVNGKMLPSMVVDLPDEVNETSPPQPVPTETEEGQPISYRTTGPCEVRGNRVEFTGPGVCRVTARSVEDDTWGLVEETFVIRVAPVPRGEGNRGGDDGPDDGPGGDDQVDPPGDSSAPAGVTPRPADGGGGLPPGEVDVLGDSFASQSITFPGGGVLQIGSSDVVSATASSGLPVSFTLTSGPCTLAGTTLTGDRAGTCVVVASQAGDAEFQAAEPVSRSWLVERVRPTVRVIAPATVAPRDAFPVSAAVDPPEAGPATFAVSGPCTIAGATVTAATEGTCRITATTAARDDLAAGSGSTDVAIRRIADEIVASVNPDFIAVGQTSTVTVTRLSPAALTTSVASGPCSVSGVAPRFSVSGTRFGDCVIDIGHDGDERYLPSSTTVAVGVRELDPMTIRFDGIQFRPTGSIGFTVASFVPPQTVSVTGPCVLTQQAPSTFRLRSTVGTNHDCTVRARHGATDRYAPSSAEATIAAVAAPPDVLTATPSVEVLESSGSPESFQINVTAVSGSPISGSAVGGACVLSGAAPDFDVSFDAPTPDECHFRFISAGNAEYAPGTTTLAVPIRDAGPLVIIPDFDDSGDFDPGGVIDVAVRVPETYQFAPGPAVVVPTVRIVNPSDCGVRPLGSVGAFGPEAVPVRLDVEVNASINYFEINFLVEVQSTRPDVYLCTVEASREITPLYAPTSTSRDIPTRSDAPISLVQTPGQIEVDDGSVFGSTSVVVQSLAHPSPAGGPVAFAAATLSGGCDTQVEAANAFDITAEGVFAPIDCVIEVTHPGDSDHLPASLEFIVEVRLDPELILNFDGQTSVEETQQISFVVHSLVGPGDGLTVVSTADCTVIGPGPGSAGANFEYELRGDTLRPDPPPPGTPVPECTVTASVSGVEDYLDATRVEEIDVVPLTIITLHSGSALEHPDRSRALLRGIDGAVGTVTNPRDRSPLAPMTAMIFVLLTLAVRRSRRDDTVVGRHARHR